ncbi:uncharacterized protein LOC143566280 [Bidens hawaiensis]|uniref:uncharacterized protein LOC143566280 n=1 Tax=Bidens hawaiensis TaxID=980011 RepID=UPI00404AF92B
MDPIDRIKISNYHPNQRDEIRRKYWLKGPCQPHDHEFPKSIDTIGIGNSTEGGRNAYITTGYKNWKEPRFDKHVGDVNSFHNKALQRCEDLVNQAQSLSVATNKQDDIVRKANQIRLIATVDLPKELGNNKYLSPSTQKDVAHCFKEEALKRLFDEICDDVFALVVDESSDVSEKEQMAIVLRYVDTHGLIKERFVGLVQVMEAFSSVLKSSIDTFFAKHNLSLSRLRGQGYDGARNMRDEYNGLKAKFLEENKSSYYVHCFAQHLQLVVVAVVKKHLSLVRFFDKMATLLNVVCACNRAFPKVENT